MAKRVSLTNAQRQSAVGAELLVLCQSITSDGQLSVDEIKELMRWLLDHKNDDLPAISFLAETVERIIEDKKVTKEERRELHLAIEKILPVELRSESKDKRKVLEDAEKARDRPIDSANFMVAGIHYDGRADVIREFVDGGQRVFLARDRQNKYSRNAIEVLIPEGYQIGYVPEDDAVQMAPLLDEGALHRAYTTKILTGSRVPIPVVQAYVYRRDARIENAVSEEQIPQRCDIHLKRVELRQSRPSRAQPAGLWKAVKQLLGF